MARQLSPGYLRLGGTAADMARFDAHGTPNDVDKGLNDDDACKPVKPFNITGWMMLIHMIYLQ